MRRPHVWHTLLTTVYQEISHARYYRPHKNHRPR